MSDLVAFLRQRLDDDEQYIRAMKVIGERFRDSATPAQVSRDTPLVGELFDGILDDPEAVAAIAAVQKAGVPNDLDRLLCETKAKRKILDEHPLMETGTYPPSCDRCWERGDRPGSGTVAMPDPSCARSRLQRPPGLRPGLGVAHRARRASHRRSRIVTCAFSIM